MIHFINFRNSANSAAVQVKKGNDLFYFDLVIEVNLVSCRNNRPYRRLMWGLFVKKCTYLYFSI